MNTSERTTISDHADVQALPSTEDVFHPSIPAELQIQIFSFACTDSDTVATDILSFTRVCRSWRHVIYSTPQFWTRLRLDWKKQYCKGARVSYGETPPISEWIERAGLHALAIDIRGVDSERNMEHRSEDKAVKYLRNPLLFHMHRLRELSISLNPEDVFPLLEVLRLDEPIRASVIWDWIYSRRTRVRAVTTFYNCPLLHTLALDVAPAEMADGLQHRVSLPWKSLKRVELCVERHEIARTTLELCTSVIHLKLRLSEPRTSPYPDSDQPPLYTFSTIQTLILEADRAFPADFLRDVAMPNLTSFTLTDVVNWNLKRSETEHNALTKFIARAPLITRFALRQSGFENEAGLYALHRLPLLEEIALEWRVAECPSWRITDELRHSEGCPYLRRIDFLGIQPMNMKLNRDPSLFLAGLPALVQARLALVMWQRMVRLQHVEVCVRNCSVEDVKEMEWCKELMALADDRLCIDVVRS
ncbi:hypothetical protein K525DRAFT_282217 [Schizophyllum commune Loenen D]|nr:hypothetical protein K525DRAFT_282217 [Schizophyllum commune Loenen D]